MSGDIVIRAEGLGKKYLIGHQAQREGYVALRDVIARNARNLARTAMDVVRGRPSIAGDELEEFWALRGVDFEIRRGEVVGVIGRNGAGKSTLLKVLSRITEPSEGRVEIRGRVASLLEVGTGFHPELTGRENVYLNGAVLGMSHAEIRRKFDEIVAFAEVERFLDTPVKRYSSGMYVRLAFAVAAHLEPEILIVDEVLAVGDAEFQKKCLGKMSEVAGHGRTVLFVSHNMAAIAQLCGTSILMETGQVRFRGETPTALRIYSSPEEAASRRAARIERVKDAASVLLGEVSANAIATEDGGVLQIDARLLAAKPARVAIEVIISNETPQPVLYWNQGTTRAEETLSLELGDYLARLTIPLQSLSEGAYSAALRLVEPGQQVYDEIDQVATFSHVRFDSGQRFDADWGNGNVQLVDNRARLELTPLSIPADASRTAPA